MKNFAIILLTCAALGGTLSRAQTVAGLNWTNSATPTVPANPGPIAVGDFDGDGNTDIAVASPTGVTILLGRGDGTFKPATTFPGQATPQALAVGTFRSSGVKDIIELSSSAISTNNASILYGDGHGGFGSSTSFSVPYAPATSIAVDDFNGDGKQDFAVTCTQVGLVAVYIGKGDGTFTVPTLFPMGGDPTCVVTGNFGGHGHRDMAIADSSNASIVLFLGDGQGNFAPGVSASVGNDPISMVAGDFNGDGFEDLAVVNYGDNTVSILLGQANGIFRANPSTFPVGAGATTIATGDFNGDGKADLVVSNATDNTVSVLLGNGDGTFSITTPINVGATDAALTVGNFSGHGNVDLAVSLSNITPAKVSVFLSPTAQGTTPTPTPTPTPIATPTPTPVTTPTPTPIPTAIPTPTPLPVGSAPVITVSPVSQTVLPNTDITFTVTAQGSSLSYQWQKDGVSLSGATASTLSLPQAQASNSGLYTVVVTNSGGSVTSAPATLVVGTPLAGRIINMSVRSNAGTGSQTLIAGFIISGSGNKPVMIRGSGATLVNFGLAGVNLTDPLLDLYQGGATPTLLSENDSWMSAPNQAQILAANGNMEGTYLLDPKDAIILSPLSAGGYTAQVKSSNNGTGVALIEVNDTDTAAPGTPEFAAQPRLTNISARSQVGTGGNILIAGFIINGNVPKRVMIRGSGPTLTNFGVTGVLPDPILKLYSGSTVIAQNDSWQSAPNLAEIMAANGQLEGAYTLDPKDTLMIVVLAPGGYTAQLSGVNNTTGVGLLEVFDLDP